MFAMPSMATVAHLCYLCMHQHPFHVLSCIDRLQTVMPSAFGESLFTSAFTLMPFPAKAQRATLRVETVSQRKFQFPGGKNIHVSSTFGFTFFEKADRANWQRLAASPLLALQSSGSQAASIHNKKTCSKLNHFLRNLKKRINSAWQAPTQQMQSSGFQAAKDGNKRPVPQGELCRHLRNLLHTLGHTLGRMSCRTRSAKSPFISDAKPLQNEECPNSFRAFSLAERGEPNSFHP